LSEESSMGLASHGEKNDGHVVKVTKKSVKCTKVLSTRAKEIKAAKKSGSYKSVTAFGDAKPCSAQLYIGLGVGLHVLNVGMRRSVPN
jgi:hypothetical protein